MITHQEHENTAAEITGSHEMQFSFQEPFTELNDLALNHSSVPGRSFQATLIPNAQARYKK